MPKLVVAVEDYATGRIFLPNANLTKQNVSDGRRDDAFLNETINVL